MTPASAWADFVRTMSPDDVLYIDGYLMDHPANREAAEAALRALPEGVRVILDVSPVIGIPDGLPPTTLISMSTSEAAVRAGKDGAYFTRDTDSAKLSSTYIPSLSVEAIDTNGAGDAHTGVLAASLAQGTSMERALVLANCAGALASTTVGPATCPPRTQIKAAADALAEQED